MRAPTLDRRAPEITVARMRFPTRRIVLLAAAVLAGGCASQRPLPEYQKPLPRARIQSVRTTAYTHTESDHLQHGRSTALGTRLRSGQVRSAAADWSRWPAGTVFRILETGETYQVDDYGWALAGTNTIDLYKPSRGQMNAWGVRRVTIENLEWGDADRSLAVLRPRGKHRHVRRMIDGLEERYAELKRPLDPPAPVETRIAVAGPPTAAAAPIATPVGPAVAPPPGVGAVPLTPFHARSVGYR